MKRLDLTEIGHFDFSKPDLVKYPALRLAFQVVELGGLSGALYNAAKEIALDAFISGEIAFLDMAHIVERVLERNFSMSNKEVDQFSLENVLMIDQMGRIHAREEVAKLL